MLKKILALSLLLGLYAQANATTAELQRRNRWTDSQEVILSEQVDSRLSRGDQIPLRRLLDLDQSYRNMEVKKIIVLAKSRRGFERVIAVVDGRQYDSENVSDSLEAVELRVNRTIGRELRTLKLRVTGDVLIHSVTVVLEADRWDRPPHRPTPPDRGHPPRRPTPPDRDRPGHALEASGNMEGVYFNLSGPNRQSINRQCINHMDRHNKSRMRVRTLRVNGRRFNSGSSFWSVPQACNIVARQAH